KTLSQGIQAAIEKNGGPLLPGQMVVFSRDDAGAMIEACNTFNEIAKELGLDISITCPFGTNPDQPTRTQITYSQAEDFMNQLVNAQSQLSHELSTSMIKLFTAYQDLQNIWQMLSNLIQALMNAANAALRNI
ncbi:MAG TPA: hypothetical protein PLV25_05510, partial [Opitutales bacterium]|nr:hypothetical protein [Opitutales bacterium]